MLIVTDDRLVHTKGRPDDPTTLVPLGLRALHVHAVRATRLPPAFRDRPDAYLSFPDPA